MPLGRVTRGLVSTHMVCVKGAEGNGIADEVDELMQIVELAPSGCKYVGLVRRAVPVVFWKCNDVSSQSTKNGSRWAEAPLQSDAERLAVRRSWFQYPFTVGTGRGKTWGVNEHLDDGASRLFRSLALPGIPRVNGGTMYVNAARFGLWHADNTSCNRIAYAGYVAMAIRSAVGFGNVRSVQKGMASGT